MSTLLEETLALRTRYDEEPSHSDHVAKLALEIYDGLRGWHALDPRHRELLHSAALLHDIGWSQTPDGKGHHKWSARLIREHPWKNLAGDEVSVVAQTARYHRKSIPQKEHADFQALPAAVQRKVTILGGILRIADALDRTHAGKIERVEASVTAEAILVRVKPTASWDPERIMFEMKSDMIQFAAERSVLCETL